MVRLAALIFILVAGLLCILAMSPKPPQPPVCNQPEALTVFLTGSELGALKPCGCSGGQLGGLDRRSAVFNAVPASKRLIVDTGSLVQDTGEQDLIKFNIILQAFDLLGYDLVNLTEKDCRLTGMLGLRESIGSVFNAIAASSISDVNVPAKFTEQFLLNAQSVTVTVAACDGRSDPAEQLQQLFPAPAGQQAVNILILNHCPDDVIASVSRMGFVNCMVCPPQSDEPAIIGDPNTKPLVVSTGRFGKYVASLRIKTAEPEDRLSLDFTPVAVTELLPQEPSLVELYQNYQQLVKEANLLEKHPRFVLPEGLAYIGSNSCKACHEYEYEKWSTRPHAGAYATLEKVGSQYDPECIVCHVVGFDYQSGFVSESQSSEDLKNVGCENCHGPGLNHLLTAGKAATAEPKSDCLDCHTPDNSADYAGHEQQYLEKIIHWREPNTPADVKNKGGSEK
jgi:hypothetical protein